MTYDPEEHALLEEQDRRRSRAFFLAFYMRMTGFLPPPHIKVIARLLQSMEEDVVDRAMLFAPPRHAKSLCGSVLLPAWLLGRDPGTKIMSVVHTQHYAAKIGRNVRNLLRSPDWPFEDAGLADDSQARVQWATAQGGEYNGFGVIGGNQHGTAAEWLIMDDLVKGRQIALSGHMREEVWETYKTDLLSRLQGRAKQLFVMTRWHQDDPPGRILPDGYDGRSGWFKDRETGEPWYVLSLPAVAEHDDDALGRAPGAWLWPDRFGDGSHLPAVRARGGWVWSALFQQRPAPEEGLMFRADMLGRFNPRTIDLTTLQVYGSSDYAVTEEGTGDNPDWTVHMVWGVDADRNIYLLDLWRGRTAPDAWVREWARLVVKHKPLRWFEEGGVILRAVGPLVRWASQELGAYTDRVQLPSVSDKPSRAQALLGLAAMGKLRLPERDKVPAAMLPALDAFEAELLQFPAGTKDDTVDAASLFARGYDRIAAGQPPKPKRAPHGDTLDDLWQREESRETRRRRW